MVNIWDSCVINILKPPLLNTKIAGHYDMQ